VFAGDEKRGQVVVLDAAPPALLKDKVALAVRYCPTHAIKLIEDEP
jgi:hypothetical protein